MDYKFRLISIIEKFQIQHFFLFMVKTITSYILFLFETKKSNNTNY